MASMHLYKTYSFKEKDPIIDKVRTIIQDQKLSYAEIERRTRVSPSTLYNWFSGPTKRPQHASIKAVIRSLSTPEYEYDYDIVKRRRK